MRLWGKSGALPAPSSSLELKKTKKRFVNMVGGRNRHTCYTIDEIKSESDLFEGNSAPPTNILSAGTL